MGSVYNLATVDSDESEETTDDHKEDLPQNPVIVVDKQVANVTRPSVPADLTELYVGETARYSVIITNGGNVTLTDVILTDDQAVVGSEVYNVTTDSMLTWEDDGGIATLRLGELAVGESIELTYDYVTVEGDLAREPISNTAIVSGTVEQPDGTTVEDDDTATITLMDIPLNLAGIEITKLVQNVTRGGEPADMAAGHPDDVFRYTVIVKNTGSLDLSLVTLTDDLAVVGSVIRNVTSATDLVWAAGSDGIATLTIGDLAAGQSITFTYEYASSIADIGKVRLNTAIAKGTVTLTLDDPEAIVIGDEDMASVVVDQIPKTGESDTARPLGLILLLSAAVLALFRKRRDENDPMPGSKHPEI